jgi:SsrA-binding protein
MSSKSGGAKKRSGSPVIADNRRARFDYEILDTLEVGIQLTGTEVKSLRANKANIAESYVQVKNGELWLINANIPGIHAGQPLQP